MARLQRNGLRGAARSALTGLIAVNLALVVAPLAVDVQAQSFEDELANLKSPTPRTRQRAARALGQSRRSEAVAPLSALVRDPEPDVRLEVVLALRELRDLSAVPALVTSLQDGDPKIRENAIGALVELYSERERRGAVSRFLQTFSDEFSRPSVPPYTTVDPSVFQGLAGTLRDEESSLRAESAQAIGILGGGPVTADLVAALQDPEAEVRGAAATALVKVGDVEDGKALIPLLADESSQVRNRAIEAIGLMGVTDAGPALRELFEQHRRRALGTRALAALTLTRDPGQADLYRELLESTDPTRRRLAVEGLARVSDPAVLPRFKKDFQREGNTDVRLAYNFAIALLGDRAFLDSIVLALSATGSRGERVRAYLIELGPEIAGDLYPYLGDQDAGVRAALADVLGELGDPASIERLTPLLNDPNSDVADAANRAIQRLRRVEPPSSFES
jgi:HEAT repeat protein